VAMKVDKSGREDQAGRIALGGVIGDFDFRALRTRQAGGGKHPAVVEPHQDSARSMILTASSWSTSCRCTSTHSLSEVGTFFPT